MCKHRAYINWMKWLVFPCLCWVSMSGTGLAQADPSDDVITLYFKKLVGCKSYMLDPIYLPNPNKQDVVVVRDIVGGPPGPEAIPLLRLHGNIAYTFDYRARLDTPFAASNLQQHNEQIYADAMFKGRYTFRIYINSRQSNSPYFKNYTDVNAQFDHRTYQQGIKDAMIAAMIRKTGLADSARKMEQGMNARKDQYYALKNWAANPARTQDIVEEKERLYQQITQLTQQQNQLKAPADPTGLSLMLPGHALPGLTLPGQNGLPGKSALAGH